MKTMTVLSQKVLLGIFLSCSMKQVLPFSLKASEPVISNGFFPKLVRRNRKHVLRLNSIDDIRSEIDSQVLINFPDAMVLDIELEDHKPLGCTAEECLGGLESENGSKHVFISKIVQGGNAEKAGIELGDVIVGVSTIFGDSLEDVNGVGLERVKSLISGRDETKTLLLRIARGTDVMSRHEEALVDLCTLPDNMRDTETEACISALYNEGYDLIDDIVDTCEDDDAECMVDTMYNIWDDEINDTKDKREEVPEETEVPKKKKVAPWASRSSPSGTYVRDPKTGKLVNIDE